MKIYTDKRVNKILNNLSGKELAKVGTLVHFFEGKGFALEEKYLKKLSGKI